jgi:hypothetical protein
MWPTKEDSASREDLTLPLSFGIFCPTNIKVVSAAMAASRQWLPAVASHHPKKKG